MLREGIKDKILRNAYKVKDLNTPHSDIIRGVILSHDTNKEERLKDKQLREEAKSRNESKKEQESGNFFVVRGDPWDGYLLGVRRRDIHTETRMRNTTEEEGENAAKRVMKDDQKGRMKIMTEGKAKVMEEHPVGADTQT